MSTGGLTYGASKAILATVVESGIGPNDPRVLARTNEAIHAILDEIIPVGGMITADVQATGTDGDELFLPKEFENAIDCEVLGPGTEVYGQTDIAQGGYNIINQFAYVDPSYATDNPLVDLFLQPDPNDSTVLRRKYRYPGLTPNATVRVTGAKRFIPITQDNDFLIVQNVLAIKDMIQSIERRENNDPQGSELYHKSCIDRLLAEVKKHQLDPRNSMRRKANYEADMAQYPQGTFGWMRARLAFELPNGLIMGKSELTRVLEQAEMTLLDAGDYVGSLQEFTAALDGPEILAPREVQSIVAIDLCGNPIDVRSVFARYQNGECTCYPELSDEGEMYNKATGERRRQYRLNGLTLDDNRTDTIRFVASLRWVKKAPGDAMTIKNFNAIKAMCQSILDQKAEKWNEAMAQKQTAINELERELGKWLGGQIITAPIRFGNFTRHGVL